MNRIRNFIRNEGGNVAMMFTLMMVVLVLFAGAAVDFQRSNMTRGAMQKAMDTAVIGSAKLVRDKTETELKALGKRMFEAALPSHLKGKVTGFTLNVDADNKVTGAVSYNMPTSILAAVGKKNIGLHVHSAAQSTIDAGTSSIEIALVLDVSGSMRHDLNGTPRIDILKEAAVDLIQDQVGMYAIVPYGMNVNVGTSDTSFIDNSSHSLFTYESWDGCVFERAAPYTNTDSAIDGNWSAWVYPPEPNGAPSCDNPSDGTNNGYVTPLTSKADAYTAIKTGPNRFCTQFPIVPLSSNYTSLETQVNTLETPSSYGTIVAPGVAWGMRVLTNAPPFTEGKATGPGIRKVIILLGDGEQTTESPSGRGSCAASVNTTDSWSFNPADFGLDGASLSGYGPTDFLSPYGFIKDSDPFGTGTSSEADLVNDLDTLSLDACSRAKAEGIEIYTILINDTLSASATIIDTMTNCATDPTYYYPAGTKQALLDAFDDIGERVSPVRLVD